MYAFDVAGAAAVGVAGLVRLLPGAIASPFAGLAGDRFPRRSVLIATGLATAAALCGCAAAAALDAPPAVVFALAALASVAVSPFVPAESALHPIVARTPQELAAANVAHGTMDSLGFLLGAVAAGGLLAATEPAIAFGVQAAVIAATVPVVLGVRRDERPAYAAEASAEGVLRQTALGFRALFGDPRLRVAGATLTVLLFFAGAADVLVVLLALDQLGLGQGSVGYLTAAWGIGSLAGGVALAVRLDRARLATVLAAGCATVGLAAALPAAWPVPVAAYAGWLGIGVGYVLAEVPARTLLQRFGSDETLGRVFGSLESARLAAMGLGSITTPAVVALLGIRGALLPLAALLPLFAALRWASLRAFEQAAPVDEAAYALLRGNEIFAPLPVATLERLTHDLVAIDAEPGERIIGEGESGDRFYLVQDGEVEVHERDALRRTEGPGEGFGEIALLRDVPRTATVIATRPTRLLALDRDHFLTAVTAHARSRLAADQIAASRLGPDDG